MKKLKIEVLYEDNHLIAVNKPGGMLVHGDETGDHTLAEWVKGYIKHKYEKPGDVFLGVIHRLDRPVSGVTIFARTSKALSRMNGLMRDRKINKTYWALTDQRPPQLEGKLENFLWKDRDKNLTKVIRRPRKDSKKAILEYQMKAEVNHISWLEVTPLTGRPHQIRVQLGSIGCPIVGDKKYGYTKTSQDRSICLHCASMAFEHPIKKEPIQIKAPMPTTGAWTMFR